jgi:hypothetical protein
VVELDIEHWGSEGLDTEQTVQAAVLDAGLEVYPVAVVEPEKNSVLDTKETEQLEDIYHYMAAVRLAECDDIHQASFRALGEGTGDVAEVRLRSGCLMQRNLRLEGQESLSPKALDDRA